MRNGNTRLGTDIIQSGGLSGGGFVCHGSMADDAWMVCRVDTETAYIRDPAGTKWDLAFRWGDNASTSDYTVNNAGAPQVAEICLAPSNSNIGFASAYGYLWKTTNRAAAWSRLSGFKSGALDQTMDWNGDSGARVGFRRMAVDPIDPTRVFFGHPKDGLYVSTDSGTTWSGPKTNTVPTWAAGSNQKGISVAIDRSSTDGSKCTKIVLHVEGVGVVRSTDSGATFAVLAGGPLHACSIEASGGKIYVCGNGGGDSQLYVHNGTSWATPSCTDTSAASGCSVATKPGTPATMFMVNNGGGMFYSTDSGVTIAKYDNIAFRSDATDVPWLGVTYHDNMSAGDTWWHPTLNRVYIACGIGVFYFDNPPRTLISQKFTSVTAGIKQLLVTDAAVSANRVYMGAEDRPFFAYDKSSVLSEATGHGPNYSSSAEIRHAGGIDYAADNENWVAGSLIGDVTGAMWISSNGGSSWAAVASWPTNGGGTQLTNGCVAVGNAGNIVWAPSNNPMKVTTNSGAAWSSPVFKDAGNTVIDMSTVDWTDVYYTRRKILWADKANPGTFMAFSYGDKNATLPATRGTFLSTDGGLNWVQKRTSWFTGSNFYSNFLRCVPGYAGAHLFWVQGPIISNLGALSADGLYFSTDYGVTTTTMTGFTEVQDCVFGKAAYSKTYPRLYVVGWRGTTYGIFVCDDFNPASPTAATWTLWFQFPAGRQGPFMLAGDMNKFGRCYAIPYSGGFYVIDYNYKLRAS